MAIGSLPSAALPYADDLPRATSGSRAWRKFARNPAAVLGALILLVVVSAALWSAWWPW